MLWPEVGDMEPSSHLYVMYLSCPATEPVESNLHSELNCSDRIHLVLWLGRTNTWPGDDLLTPHLPQGGWRCDSCDAVSRWTNLSGNKTCPDLYSLWIALIVQLCHQHILSPNSSNINTLSIPHDMTQCIANRRQCITWHTWPETITLAYKGNTVVGSLRSVW